MEKREDTPFRLALLAALFLIWLAGPLEAARDIGLVDPGKLFQSMDWWQMAMAAMLIGTGFVAFNFIAGELFNLPSAKTMAKQEFYELAVSAIIIMVVIALMFAWGSIVSDLAFTSLSQDNAAKTPIAGYCVENQAQYDITQPVAGRHPENRLYASVDFFLGCEPSLAPSDIGGLGRKYDAKTNVSYYEPVGRGVLLTEMMNQYIGLLSLEMLLGPVSTFGISFYLPEALMTSLSLNMQPNAGLTPISEATIMVTDLVGVGVGAVIMQKILLLFIHQNVLAVFLPLGLALRGVPFLRKTGSTIIAVCLILYFVYPLTVWINSQVYFSLQDKLIKWSNYSSVLELCQSKQGETPEQYRERARSIADDVIKSGEEVGGKLEGGKGNGNALPLGQFEAFWNSLLRNGQVIINYLFGDVTNPVQHGRFQPMWAAGPILPANYLFEMVVDMLTASAQIFALNIFFIINSIVICVTLFRDVSLAIGGEPRIFGMSKLV